MLRGLCALRILKVDGAVDHRDVFFNAPEKAENTKLCTCLSRAYGSSITADTADDERRDRVSRSSVSGENRGKGGMDSIHALLVLTTRVTKGRGNRRYPIGSSVSSAAATI